MWLVRNWFIVVCCRVLSICYYYYYYYYYYCYYGVCYHRTLVRWPWTSGNAARWRAYRGQRVLRKGTGGVSTNGVTANLSCFDSGTFCVLPLTYSYLPKSDKVYLFPPSIKIPYLCSGPISSDPICPQPNPLSAPCAQVPRGGGKTNTQA